MSAIQILSLRRRENDGVRLHWHERRHFRKFFRRFASCPPPRCSGAAARFGSVVVCCSHCAYGCAAATCWALPFVAGDDGQRRAAGGRRWRTWRTLCLPQSTVRQVSAQVLKFDATAPRAGVFLRWVVSTNWAAELGP